MLNYEDGVLDQSSIIPLVDGGTEGLKGNARVILPGISACVECTLDLYPPQVLMTTYRYYHHTLRIQIIMNGLLFS